MKAGGVAPVTGIWWSGWGCIQETLSHQKVIQHLRFPNRLPEAAGETPRAKRVRVPHPPRAHHTESVIHNEEKRYLIISRSSLVKRSKCFHKCREGDCSQPTFTSDSDTRKETPNHRALYLLLISALKKKRQVKRMTAYSDFIFNFKLTFVLGDRRGKERRENIKA